MIITFDENDKSSGVNACLLRVKYLLVPAPALDSRDEGADCGPMEEEFPFAAGPVRVVRDAVWAS